MNKKLRDGLFVFNNVLFIMTLAIVLTLIVAPFIHQSDVKKYALDVYSGLTNEQIQSEMSHLVNYLWIFNRQGLTLDYFPMSKTGRIHFEEVKVFVDLVQVVFIVTTCNFFYQLKKRWQQKEVLFFKTTAKWTMFVVLSFMAVGMACFDKLFVIFHQIVFRNDYWLFDYRTDPVIMILPEEFFMHGFFAILIFIALICAIFYAIYKCLTHPTALD